MRGKLSPGQRAKLAAMGLDVDWYGKALNRATLAGDVDLKGVTIPANSDELADMIGNQDTLRKIASNPAQIHAFIDAYAVKTQRPGTDIHTEVQNAMVKYLKDNQPEALRRLNFGNDDPQWSTGQRKWAAGYNKRAPGAGIDDKFADAGDYFRHVWGYKHGKLSNDEHAKMRHILNTYTEAVPADGGFLVPETLRSELLRVSLESSLVRSRARVIPMDTLRILMPMIDMSSNVSSVFGGMVAYWTAEAAALVESQAKFGSIMLEAWKLTGLAKVSNELIADSLISFTALIEQLWPQALAWFEDIAFIRGSGVGEPLGWLDGGGASNPATVAVAKESGQLADTILWENIINMYARMLPASLNNAVWVIAPNVFPQLATMALSVGTGGSAVWLPNGASGPPATLLGRPVIISEKLNTLGDQGDIAFVDLSYYLIGDRQAMSTMASEHSDFANDLTAFRIIQRVTGRPWLQNAITPQYNGSTLSPFVELAARA
jgi:HK97 family phage major capsid protein